MSPKRVALTDIPTLTFYKGEQTASRRGQFVDQLVCIGKPCNLYQPEAVRCTNVGGEGTDVEWKCEADLPKALRFGKLGVSCEGWDGPGDRYVLKGSCALEYRLTQIPNALRNDEPYFPSHIASWWSKQDYASIAFMLLWGVCLAIILYSFLKSCLGHPSTRGSTGPGHPPGPSGFRRLDWFPGGNNNGRDDPPPPYSKSVPSSTAGRDALDGWRPGFWTGAALGGLGTYLFNRRQRTEEMRARPMAGMYDWEREPVLRPVPHSTQSGFSSGWGIPRRAGSSSSQDRGEGPSNLGTIRRSTGYGGSNVR